MRRRPLENLSRGQRQATPLLFAIHLVGRVRTYFGVESVAALWVAAVSRRWNSSTASEAW